MLKRYSPAVRFIGYIVTSLMLCNLTQGLVMHDLVQFPTLRDKAPILSTDDVVQQINELADEMEVELKDNNL